MPVSAQEDHIWKAALGQLELRVSQGNFLTWFQHTRFVERKGNCVVVETANPFAYEWLSKKYHSLVLEVLKNLDETIQDVRFSVNAQIHHRASIKKNMRVVAQKNNNHPPITITPPIASPVISATISQHITPLFNPKYTFDTFIVGPSNEVAHAACQAVADKPGEAYNPLFIYGGVGLGKTHLLQAVGNTVLQSNPHFKILYVSSEKFINEFVEALRKHTTSQFKKKYRDIDVFIIDDVQFLAGKEKTQEELFHTFNTLYSQNKQVILSSDRPPTAIAAFHERLSSRLSAGMVADIKKPDYETRLAILEEKAQLSGVDIDSESLSFIAKNVQSNVRELEGALNRVAAHCQLHRERATLDFTKRVLHEILDQSQKKAVGTKQIIEVVSTYYNLTPDELCGKSRKKEIVRPRQVAMFLLRKESNMSFPSIGEYFGGRDHTTAMHACEKIEKLVERDEELSQEIHFIKERLYV